MPGCKGLKITVWLSPACFGDLKGTGMCSATVIPRTRTVREESDGSDCYMRGMISKIFWGGKLPHFFILLTLRVPRKDDSHLYVLIFVFLLIYYCLTKPSCSTTTVDLTYVSVVGCLPFHQTLCAAEIYIHVHIKVILVTTTMMSCDSNDAECE